MKVFRKMHPEKFGDVSDEDDEAMLKTLELLMDADDDNSEKTKIAECSSSSKITNCTPSTSKNNSFERALNNIDTEQCRIEEKENKSVTNTSSLLHSGETDSEDEEDNKYSFEATYSESGKALKKLINHKTEEKIIPEKRTFNRFSSWQKSPMLSSGISKFFEDNKDTILGMRLMDGSGDEATLSVDNVQKVMILGASKDLGFCKARKKSGDPCKAFVNKNHCEYCIYHIQQEYKKCSRRSELQPMTPRNGLIDIRNKVLGKNEVFYAGKSFSAIPAKRNVKQLQKDDKTLKSLFGNMASTSSVSTRFGSLVTSSVSPSSQKSSQVLPTAKQLPQALPNAQKTFSESSANSQMLAAQKSTRFLSSGSSKVLQSRRQIEADAKRLEALNEGADSNGPMPAHKISTPNSPSDFEKLSTGVPLIGRPQLSCDGDGKIDLGIDLLVSPRLMRKEQAKMKALKYIKQHGPLKKTNPNSIKKDEKSKKRKFEETDSNASALGTPETSTAEPKGFKSSRFKEMMNAESKHTALIKANEEKVQDEYFDKLEKKESLELKMLETFKISCKAVRCLKCKYTALSASERCKVERHPLKVQDAMKRFFKCGNCNNRTVSLDIIPLHSCGNCSGSNWIRAPMLRESKKTNLNVQPLSIRGDEETFIGSVANEGNINLLVPDTVSK
ncbi:hypothetical protein C0J52_20261 [Blattella germanica]|nr:hypothetical protein C0J52_20261 [Blattella germanica]